jgi:Zn-dependent metalloprotease
MICPFDSTSDNDALSSALDVVAHEIGHGFTEKEDARAR